MVALAEARELLKRHQEDPLYTDVVYWHAVALLRANEYKAALEGFSDQGGLLRRTGSQHEARHVRPSGSGPALPARVA